MYKVVHMGKKELESIYLKFCCRKSNDCDIEMEHNVFLVDGWIIPFLVLEWWASRTHFDYVKGQTMSSSDAVAIELEIMKWNHIWYPAYCSYLRFSPYDNTCWSQVQCYNCRRRRCVCVRVCVRGFSIFSLMCSRWVCWRN